MTSTPSLAPVAIGDLNGDGIPDIATASGSILFGDGKGGFPTRRDYSSNGAGSVVIADFDGDGLPDLIFGNGNATFLSGSALDPSATVLFGSGKGAFAGAPVSGVNTTQNYGLALAGDFDGDGIPDAVMFSSIDNFTVQLNTFLGQGNGQFSAGPTQTVAASSLLAGVVADFNHDGKPDVAVVNGFGQTEVIVFLGRGDGSFATPILLSILDKEVNFMAAPDLNGDGIPDLVFANASALHAWIGKSDGSFVSTFTTTVSTPSIALGDFNGDGKPDIAFVNAASTTVTVLLGKGDGTFPNAVNSSLPSVAAGSLGQMAAADFDGDRHLDVAVTLAAPGNGPSEIAVLSGKGDGTFPVAHLTSGFLSEMLAVDLNGDKIPDVVGAGAGGLVARLNNGDGTFQPETMIFPQYRPFAIADLIHDGMSDVAMFAPWGVTAFLNLTQPPPALTVVSAASFEPGPFAPGSIATAFGENLALTTASGAPSTSLSGITVTVEDSLGVSRPGPLFFVSLTQINFLIPQDSATGPATITIQGASSGKPITGQIQIVPIAPALFTFGGDVAAAYTVEVAPGGAQTIGSVSSPINLTQPGEVFLILIGTGFDSATAAETIATVQGVTATVTYAGPLPGSIGLDQINVLLPGSLAGTGVATVSVSIGGQTANPVLITIQ